MYTLPTEFVDIIPFANVCFASLVKTRLNNSDVNEII